MQASAAPAPTGVRELATSLLRVWNELSRTGGGEILALLDELDLTLTQVKTLEALAACLERPSVKELSETVGCSLANSSRTVDGLVRRGLLERREDEHDRRIKRLSVSDAGRDALERFDGVRLAGLERFAERLDPDQRRRLADALTGVPGV